MSSKFPREGSTGNPMGLTVIWWIVFLVPASKCCSRILSFFLKLSHSNAQCKSGFSVNKYLLVTILQPRSLIALRLVYETKQGLNLASITVDSEMIKRAQAKYEITKRKERENVWNFPSENLMYLQVKLNRELILEIFKWWWYRER